MLKVIYLMLLITDVNGNETLQRVNDVAYNSMFECKVDQMQHRNDDRSEAPSGSNKPSFTFYCVDSQNVTKR